MVVASSVNNYTMIVGLRNISKRYILMSYKHLSPVFNILTMCPLYLVNVVNFGLCD